MVNIQRVAAYILNETRQPMQRYYFMNTLKRKKLQDHVIDNANYMRSYSTQRR